MEKWRLRFNEEYNFYSRELDLLSQREDDWAGVLVITGVGVCQREHVLGVPDEVGHSVVT